MKSWDNMQSTSFYEASARERAIYLADSGSFCELAGPEQGFTSPHLAALGQAVSFDDGVVTGFCRMSGRPVFLISQEGRFYGGSVGEVGGAKISGVFQLALEYRDELISSGNEVSEQDIPAIVFSFESGGVRLHEANAGLLAHAEIMDLIQRCREKIPVLSLVGSRVGCFGGMGFVCVSTDALIMSELGRVGLTGPEVIEEVMGKKEFDASDRSLIYRTTGGKHKYIIGDASFLVEDTIGDFGRKTRELLGLSYSQVQKYRRIGSAELIRKQLELVSRVLAICPQDSRDVWRLFGNNDSDLYPDMPLDDFLKCVRNCCEIS